jgi:hypothetical protein
MNRLAFTRFNKSSSNSNTTQAECYTYVDQLMCNYGGSEHVAGKNCTIRFMYVKKVLVPDDCGSTGGDNSGGTGEPSDGGLGDPYSNPGGDGANTNNTETSPEEDVVTSPVKPELNGEVQQKTPCQKVKDITNNTTGLKPKITNFKTPQVLNLNHEKGFNFVDNSQNQIQLIQNDGSANSTSITVIVPEDGSMTGLVHSHFDRTDMLPTFTFEDLMTFNSIYQYRKYNQKSLDKLTLMVVTRAGVFAMIIENEGAFAANGYNLWTDQNEELRKKFNKAILEKENLTDEDVIIEVTKNLANYGVGMYQANADLSNWSKLTVDANNNKETTPCN